MVVAASCRSTRLSVLIRREVTLLMLVGKLVGWTLSAVAVVVMCYFGLRVVLPVVVMRVMDRMRFWVSDSGGW